MGVPAQLATKIATQMSSTERATERIPTARPAMMFVAAPVSDLLAMVWTGLVSVEV